LKFNLNHKLQKKEKIPSQYNEEQTLRIIRKQDQIQGERKRSKTINDIPNAASLAWQLYDKAAGDSTNERGSRFC
jgi:hypothetical protein